MQPLAPLTRRQILFALCLTSLILWGISGIWLWIAPVEAIPFTIGGSAILQGILFGILITLVSTLVYRLWPAYRHAAQSYMAFVVTPLSWFDLVWLGILPGLSEEFLFRGVALAALGMTPFVIVITNLIFGVLHLTDAHFWPYGIWATALGILLAYSLVLTHNLLVPMIAHLLANLLAAYSWKIAITRSKITSLDPNK